MNKNINVFIMLFLMNDFSYSEATEVVSEKTLRKVHVNGNGGYYFSTNEAMVNPDGCASSGQYHIRSGLKHDKEMLSILLAAKMSNKKIQFSIKACDGGYPAVDWINLYDELNDTEMCLDISLL